jgi:hypothetical protein
MLYLLYQDLDCPCGGWCWVDTPFGGDDTRDYFAPIEDADG